MTPEMITDKHLLFIVGAVAVCPKPLLGTVQANSIVGNMVMDEEAYEAFRKSTKYEHFNAVYAGSYAAVLRWISGRVPTDLAEELTQQTFMQYWQWLLAAAAFPKSDKSLLLSIARSVCADHYRAIAARAVCVAIPEDFDLPDGRIPSPW